MSPPNCDPTAEVIEKIEAAVRNLIGDKADKFMEALEKNEDASLQDAVKAAGVAPQETGNVLRAVNQILSQGWECPEKKGKLLEKITLMMQITLTYVSKTMFVKYRKNVKQGQKRGPPLTAGWARSVIHKPA